MLKLGWQGSISVRLTLVESGSFFFQPLKLHLESPNLLVQLLLALLVLTLLLLCVSAEHACTFAQQLFLPTLDL